MGRCGCEPHPDPALGFGAVGAAFAVDHQAVGLESRVEKDPDNKFLFVGIAGVGQAGCFISGKRFAFVLVRVPGRFV